MTKSNASLPKCAAMCLDLDGTLLDGALFEESIVRACREVAGRVDGLDPLQLAAANRRVWEDYWPEVEDGWTRGLLDSDAIRTNAWNRAFAECGCHESSLASLALEIHSRHARESYRLFEDAIDLLTALRSAGIPTALLTNGGSDVQREKVTVLGLQHQVDHIIVSGEVGVAKPHPDVFLFAAERLGAAPGDIWHVGDTLETDVAGANSAGMTAVWLNRGGQPLGPSDPVPDLVLRSLADLTPHIASLLI